MKTNPVSEIPMGHPETCQIGRDLCPACGERDCEAFLAPIGGLKPLWVAHCRIRALEWQNQRLKERLQASREAFETIRRTFGHQAEVLDRTLGPRG